MATKIRRTLLTGFFLFGLLIALQAQDKYEYAIITYKTYGRDLGVSINGTEFKKIEVPKEEVKHFSLDANAGIREVIKMSNEGWELFDTGTAITGDYFSYVFYLRKKVQ